MKRIHELIFVLESGYTGNVLFSSKKKAKEYLNKHYFVGKIYIDNDPILSSRVIERVLF